MYNKYIGNTGKFTRVEDHPRVNAHNAERSVAKPPPSHAAPSHAVPSHPAPQHSAPVRQVESLPPPERHKSKSLLGGLGGGLSGLLGGLGGGHGGGLAGGLSGGLGGITSSFKGMFDHLPFGLDLGDILLLLLLLFFFIESGDEEFIIILGVIAYSMFKDR